jgi:hypothetical protein
MLATGVSPWRGKSQPAGAGEKDKVIQPGFESNFFKICCIILLFPQFFVVIWMIIWLDLIYFRWWATK